MIVAVIIMAVLIAFLIWRIYQLEEEIRLTNKQVKNLTPNHITYNSHLYRLGRLENEVFRIKNSYVATKKNTLSLLESSDRQLILRIDRLEFELKHPAKYKVGDKAPDKGWVVTGVTIKNPLYNNRMGSYAVLAMDVSTFTVRPEPRNDFSWSYTATNIKTGEIKTWEE